MKPAIYFLVLALSLFCTSCSTNAPLQALSYKGNGETSKKGLIIFLRGQGGSHKDFADKGFIQDVQERNLPFDMIAPNAHFGYYLGETLVIRLKADIIEPAKGNGYDTFWLVGASMGGLGALMYTRQYPEDIKGVFLISPFLGYEGIIDEIRRAGGVRTWEPGDYTPENDWQRMLWHWLKQSTAEGTSVPDLYLGYGTEDLYVSGQHLLGEILPQQNIYTAPGGHTPATMKKVWDIFLEAEVLQ